MTNANLLLKQEIARIEQLRKEDTQDFCLVDVAAKILGLDPSDILKLVESKQLVGYTVHGNLRIIPKSAYDYLIDCLKAQIVNDNNNVEPLASAIRPGMAEVMTGKWADPAYRAEQSERIRAGHARAKAKREAGFEPTITIVARAGDPPPVPYPADAPQPPFVKVATLQSDRAAFVRPPVEPLRPAVPEHIVRYRELDARLKREFPLAFANPPNVRPLALDIWNQACKALPETDPGDLLRIITYFQNGRAYLSAMVKPGARWYNLDGTDAGPVLAFHAKESREKLQEITYRREQERR
jgi:hypothetical protein